MPIGMYRPRSKKEAQQVVDGMKNMKAKVIDKVSDAMSYPARRSAQKSMLKADSLVKDFKTVRENKGYDTSDKDYKDPVFKARANVSNFKAEQLQALRKQNK